MNTGERIRYRLEPALGTPTTTGCGEDLYLRVFATPDGPLAAGLHPNAQANRQNDDWNGIQRSTDDVDAVRAEEDDNDDGMAERILMAIAYRRLQETRRAEVAVFVPDEMVEWTVSSNGGPKAEFSAALRITAADERSAIVCAGEAARARITEHAHARRLDETEQSQPPPEGEQTEG